MNSKAYSGGCIAWCNLIRLELRSSSGWVPTYIPFCPLHSTPCAMPSKRIEDDDDPALFKEHEVLGGASQSPGIRIADNESATAGP